MNVTNNNFYYNVIYAYERIKMQVGRIQKFQNVIVNMYLKEVLREGEQNDLC